MKILGFCEDCRDEVYCTIHEKQTVTKLKGVKLSYTESVALCEKCGGEAIVSELSDLNLIKVYDAYRENKGLVNVEIFEEVICRYNIGKRNISLLLGWGEHTYSRYLEGYLPSKEYSDKVLSIYRNVDEYIKLLECNNSNLPEDVIVKSMASALKYKNILEKQLCYIDVAADYILYNCEDITPLALQKLLYYTEGFYYAFYGESLFVEACEAWRHGPVYRNIYFKYQNYRYDKIDQLENMDTFNMSDKFKIILDNVINSFGVYSGKILEDFTHNEEPWRVARADLPHYANSLNIIDKDLIAHYFIEVKEKFNMINPSDMHSYSKDMFSQI